MGCNTIQHPRAAPVARSSGPIPPFITASFTKCQVNGGYLAFEDPTQLNQVAGSVTLVAWSRLATAGGHFKLTFKDE